MRSRTVRTGLNLIISAVVLVILAAFYHEQIGLLLSLSPGSETRFIFLGLLWGGIFGFGGITVAVFGLLRSPGGARVSLMKPMVILVFLVLMFIFLLLSSFNRPESPRLRPGETLTI